MHQPGRDAPREAAGVCLALFEDLNAIEAIRALGSRDAFALCEAGASAHSRARPPANDGEEVSGDEGRRGIH